MFILFFCIICKYFLFLILNMKYKTFSEVISSVAKFSKINFDDRLEEFLTGTSKRKEEEENRKKRNDELKKELKNIENERKIDFILNKQENIFDNKEIERINKTIKLNEDLYGNKNNIEIIPIVI